MDCQSLIIEHTNWLHTNSRGPGQYKVHMTIMTNQSQYQDNKDCVVGYTVGEVVRSNPVHPTPEQQYFLIGELDQYFSDRVANNHIVGNPSTGGIPFDPRNSDRITINLFPNGQLHIHSVTWGGNQIIQLQCESRVMYGFGLGVGSGAASALYVVSLSKSFQPTGR